MNGYKELATIKEILATTRTIAVVGLSSKSSRPGYYVPSYLQKQGYRIIPINPELHEALGEQSYPDIAAVPDEIDLVLIFRRSEAVPPIVEQAVQVGSKAVWMQQGVIHPSAAEKARQAGLLVVMDACIMVEHRKWVRK